MSRNKYMCLQQSITSDSAHSFMYSDDGGRILFFVLNVLSAQCYRPNIVSTVLSTRICQHSASNTILSAQCSQFNVVSTVLSTQCCQHSNISTMLSTQLFPKQFLGQSVVCVIRIVNSCTQTKIA